MLPEMSAYISGSVYDRVSSSNSWTTALLEATNGMIELTVVMFYKGSQLIEHSFDGIRCFAVPRKKSPFVYDKSLNKYLEEIRDKIKPDVVHIHGTEYPHSYNSVCVFGPERTVISIQGLISVIARYYESTLSFKEILFNLTLRNIVFGDSVWGQKKAFLYRGGFEIKTLIKAQHVIGRTLWDEVHSTTINPNVKYHHLDELLRKEFFKAPKWSYDNCKKHTIFISQSNYPIKGLHLVIKALGIVKRKYPDVKLKIAGKPFLKHQTLIEKLSYSGYAKYLNSLISRLGLDGNIEFTGILDANGMIQEYLNANVYVCPSSIENSPNSMCEAQLLGVPCILSDVGGVYDMTNNGKSAILYRFEEFEMLAYHINNSFDMHRINYDKIDIGIHLAKIRHDNSRIVSNLTNIYQDILR